MYGFTVYTAATAEPVTPDEARKRCRLGDNAAHDAELFTAIASSRDWVERHCNRKLVTQTLELQLDQFPCGNDPIYLLPPLASVTHIKYLAASDGTETTWSSAEYRVLTSMEPAKVVPAWNYTYPASRYIAGAVTVRFVSGQAAASVPAFLKQFILSDVAASFEGMQEEFRGSRQILQSLEAYRVPDDFIYYERTSNTQSVYE